MAGSKEQEEFKPCQPDIGAWHYPLFSLGGGMLPEAARIRKSFSTATLTAHYVSACHPIHTQREGRLIDCQLAPK